MSWLILIAVIWYALGIAIQAMASTLADGRVAWRDAFIAGWRGPLPLLGLL